jgi:mono/diheme cytochrome c family protein
MNRYTILSLIALLVMVAAFPYYARREATRMSQAQAGQRQQVVAAGAHIYTDHCRQCHGDAGEGVGAMPPLNNPALAEVDAKLLFRTIARAAHGSEMAAWHIDEGGVLTDYQINQLVEFIRFADWGMASQMAQAEGALEIMPTAFEIGDAYLEVEPHECVSCHQDPEIHLDTFGLHCERCHTTLAWTPAYLTRHTFFLDHGGEGDVDCQTCHTQNYYTNTCYECHDHTPEQMKVVHLAENIPEYGNCAACHPTGQSGEARRLQEEHLIGSAEFPGMSLVSSQVPEIFLNDAGK